MKKVLFVLMALMGLMCHQTQAQCSDSVPWGTSLSFESSCWTVAPGSNWRGQTVQYVSDFDTTTDHRLLSPWIEIPATAAIDSVVVRYGTTVVCKADLSVCVTTDGVNYDTLRREIRDAAEDVWKDDTLYLGAYAGQIIRIVFCRHGLSSSYNYLTDGCPNPDVSWNLIVSGIQLLSLNPPQTWATVADKSYVGEPAVWRAGLTLGSHTGLTYTWHSTLMGQTLTGDSVTMTYTAAGVDTVTMVASNAYGSDTVVNTIQVYDCQGVITAHPWIVNFDAEYDCWRSIGAGRWNMSENSITAYNDGDKIFTSPAVVLPADSTGLRLYWKAKNNAYSGSVTYQVLVTTTNRFSIGSYDTLFSASQGTSQAQRSVSLADYAGDTIYIAFRQKDEYSRHIQISDVMIYNAFAPMGTLEAPTYAVATGDTVRYTLHLTQGDNVSHNWHSALLDTTITTIDSIVSIVYPFPGSETLTATASNAHGTLVLVKSLGVFDCNTISVFPWSEDFVETGSNASYNACWEISGYSRLANNYGYGYYEEDGSPSAGSSKHDFMKSTTRWSYMLTPPIAVPAVIEKNLSLWVEHFYSLMAIVETETGASDTIYSLDNRLMTMRRRPLSLAPYAGQTIRVRLLNNNSYSNSSESIVDRIRVDYDTLPVVVLSAQQQTTTDSATLFVATQLRGFVPGISYSWQSQVGGTFTTNATGDSAWVTYSAGITGLNDTVSVTVTNSYGSYTTRRAIRIIDCLPIDTLPWVETFSDGMPCWHKPAGSNWQADTYYGYDPKYIISNRGSDTMAHWVMSKAVTLPTNPALGVTLFWDVAGSNNTVHHNYGVWVTTSEDYTDTLNYTLLYHDTNTHTNFTGFDHLSASLAAYAGQTIHVAFRNIRQQQTNLYIDNVTIRTTAEPIVSLSSTATVNSHEEVTYTATYVEGSTNGLTFTWHSALMDTTWVDSILNSQHSSFNLIYTFGGRDTITVTASNIYGSYTTTSVVVVTDCTPIDALPWMEDFSAITPVAYNAAGGVPPACWHVYWNGSNANLKPHVINSYPYSSFNTIVANMKPLMLLAGTDEGYDSVAVVETPAFAESLNGKRLAFYYNYESAGSGVLSVGYMQDGAFVGLADIRNGNYDTVLLTGIPDEVHRVAFQWKKTGMWYGVVIDLVTLMEGNLEPRIVPCSPIPASAMVGDTTVYRVRMTDGSSDSLRFIWHSTLMDTTIVTTEPELSIVYDTAGIDNVDIVAINAYGEDSTIIITLVSSYPLPQVTLTGPTMIMMLDTAQFSIGLNNCSRNNLQFVWHSSLLDTTITLNTYYLTLNYVREGTDTITVVASNAYGADTAVAVVYVANCVSKGVPYIENFEGVPTTSWSSAGSLPLCWSSSNSGTNTTYAPHVVAPGNYPFISNLPDEMLFMVAGGTVYGDVAEATLPHFEGDLRTLLLALDYRYEEATHGTLTVGYYDSSDTFIPVDILTGNAGSYRRDTVGFATATDPDAQMVLRWSNTGLYYGVAIDNIEVFVDNGIPAPSHLTVENVSATCATLRWSKVDTATAYRVVLRGAMDLDTVVTDTTLRLCNLMDDADYTVRLTALVGNVEGLTANATFHTIMLCAPLANVSISPEGIISWQYDTLAAEQIPNGVEIEIIDQQGMVLVQTDSAYFSPYVPANLTPGHTYSFAVRTLCTSATANTADTVVMQVAPSVCAEASSNTIPSNSHFMDNFWESNYSQVVYPASFASLDTIYGIALRVAQYQPYSWQTTSGTCRYDIYVGQTNSTLTSPLTSDSLTKVVNNRHYSLSGTGWKDFIFDTPYIYDGTGDLVVTIVGRQSNTVYNPVYGVHTDATCTHFVQDEDHLSDAINPSTLTFQWETNTNIPDIRLLGGCGGSVNTCLAPEVEVTAVDTHSVSLQWAQRGSENLWKVEYRNESSNAWQLADTTSATSFIITSLSQATHYLVRVGSVCSDSLIAYGFPDSVTTLCGYMELPYTISFLADEYPCWTLSNNLYHNNWNGVTLSQWNNSYIISPEVNANIADLRATITSECAFTSYNPRFAVGVCNADGSNVTWIDTIEFLQQNTEQVDEIHFNHYTGSGRYIILRAVEASCNIRQFTLEPFAGCVPVHDMMVYNIGNYSAQLTWVPELTTNTWAVYLNGSLVATTTTPSYTLTSLYSNTHYAVSVSEICPSGDTSTAVTRLFQTLCDPFSLPYFEEFDQAPLIGNEHILTDCWVFHKAGNYATAYCVSDQWGRTFLSFDDSNEGYDVINYLSSPSLMVGGGGALVTFKGQTSYIDTFTVGIMYNPYDTSTFIPVRDITVSNGGMAWYSFSTDTIAGAPTNGTFTVAFRFTGEGSGIIDSLTVTANPVTIYTITLDVNDTAMGSVSGGGRYADGTMVTIAATPKPGYQFVMWSDSVTDATRSLEMKNDITLTAIFEALSGISDIEGSDFRLYPNPANTTVTVETDTPATLTMTDVTGRECGRWKVESGKNTIDVSSLHAGVYFVRLDSTINVRKLIIR